MSPEALAARHPRLYHLTLAAAVPGILRYGLLSTASLLDLYEIPAADRLSIEGARRPARIEIHHCVHGTATITDNSPLVLASLATCLDDGLTPTDWLRLLNARAFLWANERGLQTLANAQGNRGRQLAILVIDTLGLAREHQTRIEISAINSGATVRRPPRRGLATFTPLAAYSYADWQKRRGKRDRIREVTVLGGVPDIAKYVQAVRKE